jgi:hypothetical protein
MRYQGGHGGISGPLWLVVPIVIIGVLYRLWQLYRRRR